MNCSRNWECFDQIKRCKSNWNCTWNLAFAVLISSIVWNMCENLHDESAYFKELRNEQEYYWPTIYRAGAAVVSTITSLINRGYYMAARRYEISLRVLRNISRVRAANDAREIFFQHEEKFRISKRPYNVLFIAPAVISPRRRNPEEAL